MVHPFILRRIISVTKRDSIRSRQIQYGKNKNPIVVMGVPFRSPKVVSIGTPFGTPNGTRFVTPQIQYGKNKNPVVVVVGPKQGVCVFFFLHLYTPI